jgi:hypothetical protein
VTLVLEGIGREDREGDPGSGGDRRRQDPVQCQPMGGREGILDGQVLEVRAQQEQASYGCCGSTAGRTPSRRGSQQHACSSLRASCTFAWSRPFKWTKSADPILASAVLDPDGPTASLV